MKVSYVSDLHLEFRDYYDFSSEEGGDILLLCGDIVTVRHLHKHANEPYARSLKKHIKKSFPPLIKKYTHTYYIMGNHEHYRYDIDKSKDTLQSFFDNNKIPIQVIENQSFTINDWLFYGATLWMNFNNDPIQEMWIEKGMNDFHIIRKDNRIFSAADAKAIHTDSLNNMDAAIQNAEKVFVFTHHAPSYQSISKEHTASHINYGYYSHLDQFIFDRPQIKYWVHGHTHGRVNYKIGECNVLSNCLGYKGEYIYRTFEGLKHIEI